MLLPVGVEAPDQQPKDPVSGLEVRPRTGTELDLELVPQEQVLDQQVAPLSEELCQRGEENAEEFEHPGRIADPDGSSFALPHLNRAVTRTRALEALVIASFVRGLSVRDITRSGGPGRLRGPVGY